MLRLIRLAQVAIRIVVRKAVYLPSAAGSNASNSATAILNQQVLEESAKVRFGPTVTACFGKA